MFKLYVKHKDDFREKGIMTSASLDTIIRRCRKLTGEEERMFKPGDRFMAEDGDSYEIREVIIKKRTKA